MKNIYLLIVIFSVVYCFIFNKIEQDFQNSNYTISQIPPDKFIEATTGYLKHIYAEITFVQSSVFLGGEKSNEYVEKQLPIIAGNYQTITSLYPEFIDPYYFAAGHLGYASPELAMDTNKILSNGIEMYPEKYEFRLFKAMNYLRVLNDPLMAAKEFEDASKQENAPRIFTHLAAILSGQGGRLKVSATLLQKMLNGEKDESTKARYRRELVVFQRAIKVENAVGLFKKNNGIYPSTLEELVPDYLKAINLFGYEFEILLENNQVQVHKRRPTPLIFN